MVILWIIALVVALILEAATTALISVWFALGSIGGLIAAAADAPFFVQLIVFTLVTVVCLIFTRPFIKKFMPKKFIPTNSELDVGKKAVVIEEINNAHGKGRVKLNGVDWAAVSVDDDVIPLDAVVVVEEIRSAKLAVKYINSEE